MAIKIIENGKVEKLTLHSSDITVLDVANKFKDKNLESVITEISDTEHLHIGEVDLEKEGVWIEDNEILDSDESNGVVDRLKNYFSNIVGDLKALTTNSKDTLVNAINENTSNINQLSNPNLLINGDFQVWQRGTEFNGGVKKYLADRWFVNGSGGNWKAEKSNDAIKITPYGTEDWHCNICQTLEEEDTIALRGQTITFSTKISYADIGNLQLLIADGDERYGLKNFTGEFNSLTVTLPNIAFKKLRFEINFKTPSKDKENPLYISKVKLEMGNKATPIISRNYGEELALCQRYYQTHTPGGVANETNCLAIMSRLPVVMRINPTISYVPNSAIHEHGKGGVGTVEDITEVQCHTDRVDFIVTRQDYFTVGKAYNVEGICLDAEIY